MLQLKITLNTHLLLQLLTTPNNTKLTVNVTNYQTLPGHGIQAIIDDSMLFVGNQKLMLDHQINIQSIKQKMKQMEAEGHTVMLIAYDGAN